MVTASSTQTGQAPNSGYNYVVTAQKPTAVTASLVGHFTSPRDINLIISKTTRIEIHTLAEGLQGVLDVPLYGRIAAMELFRPVGKDKDLLFFLTEQQQFSVVEYDSSTGELVTQALGDAASRVGRINENGSIGIIDKECRMIALHIYDAIVKIIPIDSKGKLQEAFDVRIDEMCLIDLKFLEGTAEPTLAVLSEDPKKNRHIKTYEVNVKDKAFEEGPWKHNNLDAGATMIIPVPTPLGGAIVVGESVITYFNQSQLKTVPIDQTTVRAYGQVDEDGSRYLLGDLVGHLYLLVLNHDGKRVLGLKLQSLGRTSAASTISYLDNAVVYVGSATGDSQLIRLHPEAVSPNQPSNFVEVLDTFTNLGPIVDFSVIDLDRQGQGQVVTCSGARTDGSLRIVRNGIGMIGQATIELPGLKGLWSLRFSSADTHDSRLVLTFVGETRLLAINNEDELEEAELDGFDADSQTLYCGNAVDDHIIQVTQRSARLLSSGGQQLIHEWSPLSSTQINVAAGNASQVLLASGEGNLVLLEVSGGMLTEKSRTKLASDVACLDLSPIGAGRQRADLAAVGTWDHNVHVLCLPDLSVSAGTESLGGEVIPRSVLFTEFEGLAYLLVALGDGQLYNYHIDPSSGSRSEQKRISLGTKPITLHKFSANGASYVFAASDRPTVIYSSNQKLLYSNLNENEVNFMAPFNSKSFPDSLAIAKEGSLTIGSIDEVQKLHIRTVPLGEQPRRVAHLESARAFLVVTSPHIFSTGLDDAGNDSLRLMDDQTFEVTDQVSLQATETGCSMCTVSFTDDAMEYFVVGTAFVQPDEPEPTKVRVWYYNSSLRSLLQLSCGLRRGVSTTFEVLLQGRLLVIQSKDGKLQIVAEKEVKGCPYSIAAFQGKLLAGVNARVQIFKWQKDDDGAHELSLECQHTGHILALYVRSRGDFIAVGDIMRSIDLLVYKPEENVLEPRAKDYNAGWMTAVEILDDDTYLGAEASYNLFTLRKNSDAASDEDRGRLEVIGEYHLGEFVNRFQHGSLVMQMADSEAAKIPTVLFGTITGMIGVLASLPPDLAGLLEKLQDAIKKVIKGVGGLDHTSWRVFKNERGVRGCRNFIDGDLIEQFLDLRKDVMQRVVDLMGTGTSVEELTRVVEELSRALH